jgi:ABC-type sugar transport system ATPase subunit
MSGKALIELRGISKSFPGVRALHAVTLAIGEGTTHALVGENGAGKSTLGKIIAGLYRPDSGEMLVAGRVVSFTRPTDAIATGIGMVHQELLFCENLSVAENLCLGALPTRAGFISRRAMEDLARRDLERIGSTIDPRTEVGRLSVGQQQLIQIAGAVARGARVLIFDEPTSSLSASESENLFSLMGRLRAEGVTMVYVSHRMHEIFRLCDTISVLRDGEHIGTRPTSDYNEADLVRDMVGRTVETYTPRHLDTPRGAEILKVENFSGRHFSNISFTLHAGEILGLGGLVGAGRTEVSEALFGLDHSANGSVLLHGKPYRPRHPRQALSAGVGLIPEDRKRHGLTLSMNARENITLPILDQLARFSWVRNAAERALAGSYFARLRVRAPHLDTATAGLSGGNQQKLVMARWVAAKCGVLLIDEPTRGVDVGAKAEIHALIDEVVCAGAAVLLISSDLPELLSMSSRVLVLREGRMTGEVPRAEATQDRVLRLMAGLPEQN